jgi:predicted O-linked N-acetylglucosamine transferase (SPINDLY family)
MSTPVVSLVGTTATSRGGASLLQNVGVPELIAETSEQYVSIAARLAQEPDVLTSLRSTLRQRMRSSPLTDAIGFTRHLEAAYRIMWQRWCAIH